MIKLIILVGCDGCGKTTIKKALEKKTNYQYFVVDRLTDSFVYKRIFNRKIPTDFDILKFELKLDKIAEVYLVYLYADTDILLKRIKLKGDKETRGFIDKTKDLFQNEYLSKTYLDFIEIDTGKYNIKQTVKKIIKFVNKPKNE